MWLRSLFPLLVAIFIISLCHGVSSGHRHRRGNQPSKPGDRWIRRPYIRHYNGRLDRVHRQAEDDQVPEDYEYRSYEYEDGYIPEFGSDEYYEYDGEYEYNDEDEHPSEKSEPLPESVENSREEEAYATPEPPEVHQTESDVEEEELTTAAPTRLHPTYEEVQRRYEEEQRRLEEEQRRFEEEQRRYDEQEISYEEEHPVIPEEDAETDFIVVSTAEPPHQPDPSLEEKVDLTPIVEIGRVDLERYTEEERTDDNLAVPEPSYEFEPSYYSEEEHPQFYEGRLGVRPSEPTRYSEEEVLTDRSYEEPIADRYSEERRESEEKISEADVVPVDEFRSSEVVENTYSVTETVGGIEETNYGRYDEHEEREESSEDRRYAYSDENEPHEEWRGEFHSESQETYTTNYESRSDITYEPEPTAYGEVVETTQYGHETHDLYGESEIGKSESTEAHHEYGNNEKSYGENREGTRHDDRYDSYENRYDVGQTDDNRYEHENKYDPPDQRNDLESRYDHEGSYDPNQTDDHRSGHEDQYDYEGKTENQDNIYDHSEAEENRYGHSETDDIKYDPTETETYDNRFDETQTEKYDPSETETHDSRYDDLSETEDNKYQTGAETYDNRHGHSEEKLDQYDYGETSYERYDHKETPEDRNYPENHETADESPEKYEDPHPTESITPSPESETRNRDYDYTPHGHYSESETHYEPEPTSVAEEISSRETSNFVPHSYDDFSSEEKPLDSSSLETNYPPEGHHHENTYYTSGREYNRYEIDNESQQPDSTRYEIHAENSLESPVEEKYEGIFPPTAVTYEKNEISESSHENTYIPIEHRPYYESSEEKSHPTEEIVVDSSENEIFHESQEEGSARIECFLGYQLSADSTACLDVNECLQGICGPLQTCENTPGSYHCTCPPGYRQDYLDPHHCVDWNECEADNGGCNQDCINTQGSYLCSCSDDFELAEDHRTCRLRPTTTTTTTTTTRAPYIVEESSTPPPVQNCPTPPVPRGSGIAYLYCSRSPVGIHHRHSQLERQLLQDWAAKRNRSKKLSRKFLRYRRRRRNLRRKSRQTTYAPGSMCELRCRAGFQLSGTYRLNCNSSGFWEGGMDGFCEALRKVDPKLPPPGTNKLPSNEIPRLGPHVDDFSNRYVPRVRPTTAAPTTFRPIYYRPPPAPASRVPLRPAYSPYTPPRITTTSTTTPAPTTTTSAPTVPSRYYLLTTSRTSLPPYYAPQYPYNRYHTNSFYGNNNYPSRPNSYAYRPYSAPPPASGYSGTTPKPMIFSPVFTTPLSIVTTKAPVTTTLPSTTYRNSYIQLTYRFKTPWIKCPDDISIDLPPGQNLAYVILPQPQTNVDWWRQVTSDPGWAKNLETEMGPGKQRITFRARTSAPQNNMAECSLTLEIRDAEPPRVRECPESFSVKLNAGQNAKTVTWTEPQFTDNVRISSLKKSHEPGTVMTAGDHLINYEAIDSSGNRARCSFSVNIVPSGPPIFSNSVYNNGHKRPYGIEPAVTTSPRPEIHAALRKVVCYVGRKGRRIVFQSRVVPRGCSEMKVDILGDTSQGAINSLNTVVQNSAENSATSQISSVSFSSQDNPPSSAAFGQAVSNGRNANRLVHSTSSVTNGKHGTSSKASSYAVSVSSSSRNFGLPFLAGHDNKQIYEEHVQSSDGENGEQNLFIIPSQTPVQVQTESNYEHPGARSAIGRRVWSTRSQQSNINSNLHPNHTRKNGSSNNTEESLEAENIVLDSSTRRSGRNRNSTTGYRQYFRHFDSWDVPV